MLSSTRLRPFMVCVTGGAFCMNWLVPATLAQVVERSVATAEIRALQPATLVGQPIWIEFLLHNPTNQLAVLHNQSLRTPDLNAREMGLPLDHVLGLGDRAAVVVMNERGEVVDVGRKSPQPGNPIALRLAPHATVGLRLDVREYCRELSSPGKYRLRWRPYDGALESNALEIEVLVLKSARIETDYGPMDIRLFYDVAPRHVENFIELIQSDFYDNLTFHRLIPGYLIQGGSPGELVAGMRPDGETLEPEFNEHHFRMGSVGMARRPDDPGSASCQFFICYTRWPELDGEYTAFGELVGEESYATLDRLMATPVDADGKPLKKVYIRDARVVDAQSPHGPPFSSP